MSQSKIDWRQKVNEVLATIQKHNVENDLCYCNGCESKINEIGPVCCLTCGYTGKFVAISCQCYDENAWYCRTNSPGSCCPHGALTCPVCDFCQGETIGWDVVREVHKVLGGRYAGNSSLANGGKG